LARCQDFPVDKNCQPRNGQGRIEAVSPGVRYAPPNTIQYMHGSSNPFMFNFKWGKHTLLLMFLNVFGPRIYLVFLWHTLMNILSFFKSIRLSTLFGFSGAFRLPFLSIPSAAMIYAYNCLQYFLRKYDLIFRHVFFHGSVAVR